MIATAPLVPETTQRRTRWVAIAGGALVIAGAVIAAATGTPSAAPSETQGGPALTAAARVLSTYERNAGAFGREGTLPADLGTFRAYTQWLAAQPGNGDLDPADLATVTYVLTSDGPCLQTYEQDPHGARAIHQIGDQALPGHCPTP